MKLAKSLKVLRVDPQGSDAVLLSFTPDAAQQADFHFRPGQYLTVMGGPTDNEQWRCYSLTSDPADIEVLSVLVRRVPGGLVSNWLCDHIQPGQHLQVFRPAGHFALRQPGRPTLLFAGGSGIAPIYSLARQALAEGASRVCLFYANRDRGTAMLMKELAALQEQYGERIDLRCWYDAEQGLPTAQALADCTIKFDADEAYLCGPEPFMNAVQGALLSVGMGAGNILREEFILDAADDFDAEGPAKDRAGTATLLVHLKGQTHQVEVQKKDTLLAAMIKSGLTVPHACKVGECASCMCRLESGEIDRLSNSVLDEDDVEAGWLVACRTHAISDEVRIRFG